MKQKNYRTINNYTSSRVNFSDIFIYGIGTTSQSTGVSSAIFVTRTPAHTVNASWQGTGPWFRKGDWIMATNLRHSSGACPAVAAVALAAAMAVPGTGLSQDAKVCEPTETLVDKPGSKYGEAGRTGRASGRERV